MPRMTSETSVGSMALRRCGTMIATLGVQTLVCVVSLLLWPLPSLATRHSSLTTTIPAASQPALPQSPAEFTAWYQQQLQDIDPKDSDRLYKLALACLVNKHPEQAAEVAKRILASWPDHAKAKSLLRTATQQIATSRLSTSQSALTRPASQPSTFTSRPQAPGILTAEAINRLRFAEFAYKDMEDRPHVVIPTAVSQEFLAEVDKTQAMTDLERAQFQRSDNDDRLRWIVLHTGFRFADRIQVNSEPRSLTTYRQRIWPIISRTCALPACHGGGDAGRLRLILPATLPAAGATNFYLLNTFEGDDGRLINREHPEASLLLQYGLPTDQAELKHPVAIKPIFTMGTNDTKYHVLLDWIRSLRTPTPDYRVSDKMWQSLAPGKVSSEPAETQPARPSVGH